jgi:hypothetical protein
VSSLHKGSSFAKFCALLLTQNNDRALDPQKSGNFLGIDIKNRNANIWDSGNARFSVSTSTNTGLATVRAIMDPERTKNTQLFISDFVTTPRELLTSLERLMNAKFTITQAPSEPVFEAAKKKIVDGEYGSAIYDFVSLSFVADVDVGLDFEKEHELSNDLLRLPAIQMDDVLTEAIENARNPTGKY